MPGRALAFELPWHVERPMTKKYPVIFLNAPNILTLFRFVCVGLLIWAFARGLTVLALIFYAVAGVTDVLDGYIARKYKMITPAGKLLDPLADKLMTITVLVCLYLRHSITAGILVVVLVKEGMMVAGGWLLLHYKDKVVQSNSFGKFTAMFFFCSLVLTFFHDWVAPVDSVMIYVATALSIASLLQYWYLSMLKPYLDRKEKNR
jgi:cardiolipin synthase